MVKWITVPDTEVVHDAPGKELVATIDWHIMAQIQQTTPMLFHHANNLLDLHARPAEGRVKSFLSNILHLSVRTYHIIPVNKASVRHYPRRNALSFNLCYRLGQKIAPHYRLIQLASIPQRLIGQTAAMAWGGMYQEVTCVTGS